MAEPTSRRGFSASTDGHVTGETVEEFLEEWLQSIAYSVRPRTWERYAQYVRLHVSPLIGKIPLKSLRPKDLQLAYAEPARAGLSNTSILHMHRAVHRAFAQAHEWGFVDRNVAAQVNPPRGSE